MLDCTYTIWRCSSWKYCCSCFIKVRFIIIIQFRKFVEGINGTSCSIFKLYKTVTNGEEKTTIPKWIGVTNLTNTLQETKNAISKVKADVDLLHLSKLDSSTFDNYYKQAVQEYEANVDKYSQKEQEIDNYSIQYNNPPFIIPQYIANFNKYLDELLQEKILVMDFGINYINKVKEASSQINENADVVISSIDEASVNIQDLESTFTDLADDVLDDWVKYQDYVNDYANLIFYILTGLMMAFGVAGFICTFFYASFDKCQCLRIILHFVWNFLALFTFILLLLGSVFGLLGTIGSDGVGVMEYAFTDNLKDEDPIIIKGDALDYVDTCISGDGNLYSKFNLADNADDINKIYNLNKELDTYSTLISNLKPSFNTTTNKAAEYAQMESISLTNTTINADLQSVNSQTANFNCNKQICNDKWVEKKDDCPLSQYCNIINSESSCQGNANCFVINDYFNSIPEDFLNNRYGASSNVVNLLTNLMKYSNKNQAYLKHKNEENYKLNEESEKFITELKREMKLSEQIISPLGGIYKELVGDESVETLMNCKFMSNNINIFYDQMDNGLSGHATSFAISTLFSACCAGLSNLFVLLVIHKFRKASEQKKPEPEVKQTEENESFKPEPKPTEEAPAVATHPVDINETEHPINPSDVKIEMTDQA